MCLWLSVRAYVYSNQVARGVSRASVSQSTLRNPEKPSVCVKPVKPVHEPIWRFFFSFRSTCLSTCKYPPVLLNLATVLKKQIFWKKTVKTFPSKQRVSDVLSLDLLAQKGSSHFGLKKLPDLASLWEGVELFSRKQGRISPRLKFLLYQYKSEIVLLSSKVYRVFFWKQDSTRSCHIQHFFLPSTTNQDRSCFCFIEAKKRIFETCWYQCTVLVNVICSSVWY